MKEKLKELISYVNLALILTILFNILGTNNAINAGEFQIQLKDTDISNGEFTIEVVKKPEPPTEQRDSIVAPAVTDSSKVDTVFQIPIKE